MKRALVASAAATFAFTGTAMMASPAQAAPLVTGGLVNVTVTDFLNDNTVEVLNDADITVQAALELAVQVCGNSIGVIAQDLAADGTCTNAFGDTFQIDQR